MQAEVSPYCLTTVRAFFDFWLLSAPSLFPSESDAIIVHRDFEVIKGLES